MERANAITSYVEPVVNDVCSWGASELTETEEDPA
jgi:hypothetical protein